MVVDGEGFPGREEVPMANAPLVSVDSHPGLGFNPVTGLPATPWDDMVPAVSPGSVVWVDGHGVGVVANATGHVPGTLTLALVVDLVDDGGTVLVPVAHVHVVV